MRTKRPLLSPLIGIPQAQEPRLVTIEEENCIQLTPLDTALQASVPAITSKATEDKRRTSDFAAVPTVEIAGNVTKNRHSKSSAASETIDIDCTSERGPADSNESAIVRILDHDTQPNEQAVNIGWTVSPMPNGSLCTAEIPSISRLEESPLACATAVQEINRAVILGPLLHRRPVKSAELSHQCLRGKTISKLYNFRKLSTALSVTPAAYTDTSDDLP
ncbi:Hypothetical protein GLP15_2206 [Giardia lamblia P15]|uniref:Uncharacterized protein n=1 Tax=Giardia intestinalis (strain P15) TaxID=658858 RepID=E1F6U5_GIAIA|nr:Hypothetical protein GLP15_2206 [Giardia lamblia P15]